MTAISSQDQLSITGPLEWAAMSKWLSLALACFGYPKLDVSVGRVYPCSYESDI